MPYQEHWSAIRSRQPNNTHLAPPSPYLARVRSEATRRGLYAAAGPVTQPPPPAAAAPTTQSSIPPTPQAAEARWASDAALRSEFRDDKGRFLAYCRAAAAGRVRIAAGRVVTRS